MTLSNDGLDYLKTRIVENLEQDNVKVGEFIRARTLQCEEDLLRFSMKDKKEVLKTLAELRAASVTPDGLKVNPPSVMSLELQN